MRLWNVHDRPGHEPSCYERDNQAAMDKSPVRLDFSRAGDAFHGVQLGYLWAGAAGGDFQLCDQAADAGLVSQCDVKDSGD
jgi:hypothetical protein